MKSHSIHRDWKGEYQSYYMTYLKLNQMVHVRNKVINISAMRLNDCIHMAPTSNQCAKSSQKTILGPMCISEYLSALDISGKKVFFNLQANGLSSWLHNLEIMQITEITEKSVGDENFIGKKKR